MIIALHLFLNWHAININNNNNTSSNTNYIYFYYNRYVFVLINSPEIVMKPRFLFLLNNCHSKLKKINERKEKNQIETVSTVFIVHVSRDTNYSLENQMEKHERNFCKRKKKNNNGRIFLLFCLFLFTQHADLHLQFNNVSIFNFIYFNYQTYYLFIFCVCSTYSSLDLFL